MHLKCPMPEERSTYPWCIESVNVALVFISAAMSGPARKFYYHICHWHLYYLLNLFVQDLSCVACLLICFLFELGSIVLQFTTSSSNVLTFGMPSSDGHLPGTKKNLHSFCLSFYVIVTLYTPGSGIHEVSHVSQSCGGLNVKALTQDVRYLRFEFQPLHIFLLLTRLRPYQTSPSEIQTSYSSNVSSVQYIFY